MNIIYVVLMTMHVDYGNTYRLNRLLPFFLMTYGLNVQLFTLPKTIFVKKSYYLKVKSFDFLLLATFFIK